MKIIITDLTVTFTDFDNKSSYLFSAFYKFLELNKIKYLSPSNSIVISKYDFDKLINKYNVSI